MIPLQLQDKAFKFLLIRVKDKIPIEKDWQNTANYEFDDPIITDWVNNGGNYGVLCGKNNLVVVDFDNKDFYDEIIKTLPETFSVKTGSGLFHLYYIADEPIKSFKVLNKEGKTLADIQGIGKQVIGANSIHPNGNKYEVFNNIPITRISSGKIRSLMDKSSNKNKTDVKEVLSGKVQEGNRNGSLFKLACVLRTKDIGKEEAHSLLLSANEKFSKPLPKSEIKTLLDSAYNYDKEIKSDIRDVYNLRDILNNEIPPINWLCDTIIKEGGLTLITGKPANFKSWFVMQLVLSYSLGISFLDKFSTKKGKILYVDEENGYVTIANRFNMIKKGLKLSDNDIQDNVIISIFNNCTIDEGNNKILENLIIEHKPQLIVIDSLVRCITGDENYAKDMKKVFVIIKDLIKKYNVSFVMLHHLSKNNYKGVDSVRGSGDIIAQADVVLMLFSSSSDVLNINFVKNRHIEKKEINDFFCEIISNKEDNTFLLNFKDIQKNSLDHTSQCYKVLIEWTEGFISDTFQTKDAIKESNKCGFAKDTTYKALYKMQEDGFIEKTKRGQWIIKNSNYVDIGVNDND